MLVSGAENGVAHCLPALAVTCLPLCLLRWERGLVCIRLALLWYSLNPLFCEKARLCLRLEPFVGKFFFFFFLFLLFLAIPQFGLLSQVSSLRLSSSHSGLVLTLSVQPAPPCPAPTHWWPTRASGLLLCWELQFGAYSVCVCVYVCVCVCVCVFPCWLCCPLRFQSSLQTCQ